MGPVDQVVQKRTGEFASPPPEGADVLTGQFLVTTCTDGHTFRDDGQWDARSLDMGPISNQVLQIEHRAGVAGID